MGVMRPRPPASQGLRAANTARDKDLEQFRRSLSTAPKPKPAPPSGGIVGMAQVLSTGGVSWASGNSEMSYGGVTYGAPSDPNDGTDGASSPSWLSIDGYQLFVTPGWYIPVLTMRVTWDDVNDAPLGFSGPYMSGGYDSAHNDNGCHARVPFSTTNGGFQQVANYGPTFIPAGSDLHAELRSLGGPPTASNNPSPALSRIVWNITKL